MRSSLFRGTTNLMKNNHLRVYFFQLMDQVLSSAALFVRFGIVLYLLPGFGRRVRASAFGDAQYGMMGWRHNARRARAHKTLFVSPQKAFQNSRQRERTGRRADDGPRPK
jgi:hypothetical protein